MNKLRKLTRKIKRPPKKKQNSKTIRGGAGDVTPEINKPFDLQTLSYKALPKSKKKQILQNPNLYPTYENVIMDTHNNKVYRDIGKNIKPKLKLTKKRLRQFEIFQDIYNHIIKQNKNKKQEKLRAIDAWSNFALRKDAYYEDEELWEKIELWPKHMFLVYYTYKICYSVWFDLEQEPQMIDYILPFDRENDNFINYISQTYHNLDRSISLEDFRFMGY